MKKFNCIKTTKLLLIGLLTVLFISCSKEDVAHSLDNTRWISRTYQGSDQAYALTFNNGYMQEFRLDPETHEIRHLRYTAKYSLKGNKLTVYIKQYNGEIKPYEGRYEEGIVYWEGDEYYLQ